MLHIASAVVKARPPTQDAVAARIAELAGADVLAIDHGRIIVVLEASRAARSSPTRSIASPTSNGVLSATLVFEHSDVFEHSEPDGDPA